jgi:hypothetical protein
MAPSRRCLHSSVSVHPAREWCSIPPSPSGQLPQCVTRCAAGCRRQQAGMKTHIKAVKKFDTQAWRHRGRAAHTGLDARHDQLHLTILSGLRSHEHARLSAYAESSSDEEGSDAESGSERVRQRRWSESEGEDAGSGGSGSSKGQRGRNESSRGSECGATKKRNRRCQAARSSKAPGVQGRVSSRCTHRAAHQTREKQVCRYHRPGRDLARSL